MKNLLIIFTIIIFYSSLTQAQQAGSLDLSFDGDGKVVTNFPSLWEQYDFKMDISTSGEIIIAGPTFSAIPGILIAKYKQDGTLDNSFGQNGSSTIILNYQGGVMFLNFVKEIKVQTDGKIVLVGYVGSSTLRDNFPFVARLNSNGFLDNTFGTNGVLFLSNTQTINDFTIQSNGKILIIGNSFNGVNYDFQIRRLNSNGSLDLGFGNSGIVNSDFGNHEYSKSVVQLLDGKIIVGGNSSPNTINLASYNIDGTLNTDFDFDGKKSIDNIQFGSNGLYSISFQTDGKIVGVCENLTVFRINPNGDLDTNLDLDGIKQILIPNIQYQPKAAEITVQYDNKIIIIGKYWNQKIGVFRLNYDGNFDSSFDSDGIQEINLNITITNNFVRGTSVKIQSDGKILLAGNGYKDFALVRLHGINNFTSNQGKIYTQFNTNNDVANAIAMRAGGKPIVVGNVTNAINPTSGTDFGIVAYNADGSLDYAFGSNAFVSISFDADDRANAVAVQTNDKILVAGKAANGSQYNLVVVRYNANGTLDNTFGISGIATLEIDDFDTEAMSIAIQTDGKIVVTGLSQDQFNGNFYAILARFNTNGFLDNTFGTNGVVDLPAGNGYVGKSVAIQSDGKIVIACASQSSVGNFVVIRCNANGSADNTFDTDGKVSTNVGTDNSFAKSLVLQSDGKIVVCGAAKENSQNVFAMLRYTTNGSLDNSFDTDGIVLTSFSPIHATANAVAVQPDGKIFLTGNTTITTNADMVLARYSSDGVLDQSFNYSGKLILPFGYGNEGTNAMISNANGTAYLAGFYHNGHDNDFAMVKIVDCMQYIDVTLENPSNNYPNSLLPNPVYGKSINASNFINATSNVTYKTNSSVILNPGFQANIGSVFKTETGGCAY